MNHIEENEGTLRMVTRACNLALLSIGMFGSGIYFMADQGTYISIIIGLYICIFAIILTLLEFRKMPEVLMSVILRDCRFLLTPFGRTLSVLLVAMLLFAFGTFGRWIAALLILISIVNGLLMSKFPDFEAEQFGHFDDLHSQSNHPPTDSNGSNHLGAGLAHDGYDEGIVGTSSAPSSVSSNVDL